MSQQSDSERTALIVSAKKSLREAQRSRTWEQRVAAIARMNAANKIAKRVGSLRKGPTTDELMRLTRGDDWGRE